MNKHIATLLLALIALQPSAFAMADCMAIGFAGEPPQNPKYRIISCSHASIVIDQFRESNPAWYGNITFSEDDVAVRVTFANDDARRLMFSEFSYWYYSGGCGDFSPGQILDDSEIDNRCCDVGPVRDVQCGLGGERLVSFN